MAVQKKYSYDYIFISALLLCGFIYLCRITALFSAFPGDLCDARFNQVVLEHVYKFFTEKNCSLFSPDFFYPFPGSLAFSDTHLGSIPTYFIPRILGAPREIAFGLWFCIAFVVNFASCYYVLLSFNLDKISAAIGAFIFSFGLPAIHQEGHSQLMYRFPVPFATLSLVRYMQTRRLHYLAVLILFTSCQFLLSIYLGYFISLYLGAMFFVRLVSAKSRNSLYQSTEINNISQPSRFLRNIAIYGTTMFFLGATLYVLYMHHYYTKLYALTRSTDYMKQMLPRFGSYFMADGFSFASWVGAWVKDVPMRHEHQLFIGIIPALLCLYGLFALKGNSKYQQTTILIKALFLVVLFTLSIQDYSFYDLIANLPGANSIMAVSRIILILLFPIALLAAIGCSSLLQKYSHLKLYILATIAFALIAEFVTHVPSRTFIKDARQRIASISQGVNVDELKQNNKIILSLNTEKNQFPLNALDVMIFAQDNDLKTFDGYSGNCPPVFATPRSCQEASDWFKRIEQYDGPGQSDETFKNVSVRAYFIPIGQCAE